MVNGGRQRGHSGRVTAAVLLAALVALLSGACSSDSGSAGPTTTAKASSTTASTSTTVAAAAPTLPPVAGTGGVTVDPAAVPVGANDQQATVKVSWQGQQPATLMFVRVCRKSVTDQTFSAGTDCSLLSEVTPNGTPNGANSIDFTVFRGENPDGDSGWGCFAPGDAVPAGIQGNTTCYVRVTNDVIGNTKDQRDAPFTFVAR